MKIFFIMIKSIYKSEQLVDFINIKDIMDKKTYIEELKEKESAYGKIFKVSGPCKLFIILSGCC